MVLEWGDDIDVNVQESKEKSVLAATGNVVIVHANADSKCTTLFEIQNLRVEDGRDPVSSKDWKVVKHLEAVHPGASGMTKRIVIEEQHGLGSKAVRVHFSMIRVRVVSPVLFHPKPLGPADKVRSKTQNLVHPGLFGRSTVIGVMLHIETNEGLGNTVNYCQQEGRSLHHPEILKVKEETNESKGAEEVTGRSELPSATHDLEHLLLDISLKGSIKLVPAEREKGDVVSKILEDA